MIKNWLIDYDTKLKLSWLYSVNPHILLTGGTGSGKTYTLTLLIGKCIKHTKNPIMVLSDYKASDEYSFIDDDLIFKGSKVSNAIELVHQEMKLRQFNGNKETLFLIVDEWPSFVLSEEKNIVNDAKKKLAEILMLGRSLGIHLIVACQRADSSYFLAGSRDNFSVRLGLGSLSSESRRMMFPDSDSSIFSDNVGRGRGYLFVDGKGLKKVLVPQINDIEKLKKYIANYFENENRILINSIKQ